MWSDEMTAPAKSCVVVVMVCVINNGTLLTI